MLQRILLGLIRVYRTWISPWTPASCRFEPTCSAYAREAIERHGAGKGSVLAVRRLFRCHPWGGMGYDPVPPTEAGKPNEPLVDAGEPVRGEREDDDR